MSFADVAGDGGAALFSSSSGMEGGCFFRGETWRMRVVFGFSRRRRRDATPFPKRPHAVAELQRKRCVVQSLENTAQAEHVTVHR